MKTKGITIWERYAERFVLGAAAVLAIGFTAMQFVGRPNAVSTSTGLVAPHEVDRLLQQRAEQLLSKLGDDAPPGLELKDPKPALDDLRAQRVHSLSPRETLRLPALALLPDVGNGAGPPRGNEPYPEPVLPAPARVSVRQFTDTLADGVVEEQPDVQKLFASQSAPHDLTWATVRAEFDLAVLRKQFALLPSNWFNDHPENMLDVVVERQEQAGDDWTDLVKLDPIPGQATVRPQLAENLDSAAREQILGWLADPATQLAVIQPDFYALRNGDWDPNWAEDQAGESKADGLRKTLKSQLAELDRLLEELHSLGGKMEDDSKGGGPAGAPGKGGDAGGGNPGGPGDGPGSGRRAPPGRERRDAPGKGGDTGGGFGTGGMGPGDSGPGPDKKDSKAKELRIKNLQVKIRSQERKIALTKDALRKLGVDVDTEEQAGAVDAFAVLKGDKVLVWAHDLTARPDRTYRYRLTVRVYNPFFGRKRSLVEAQQALAEAFCLDTPPSEWSKPITMSPPLRVFITSAMAGSTGPARVIAEVYRFYDGTQWMDTFSVAPGGAIGGRKQMPKRPGDTAAIEVDFTTGFFVLDVVEKIGSGKGGAPEAGGDARVLLHDVRGERRPVLRDPHEDLKDAERDVLRDKLPKAGSRPA